METVYTNAVYAGYLGKNTGIYVTINGVYTNVPLDPNNTDYAAIMKLQEEGKLTIAPAQ
jgi:hypothetical protein